MDKNGPVLNSLHKYSQIAGKISKLRSDRLYELSG